MSFTPVDTIFDPALYSEEELLFIKEHAGETPVVAFGGAVPPGQDGALMVPKMVSDVLARMADLESMEKQGMSKWVGFEAVKSRIDIYLTRMERFKADKARRGYGFHPELHAWDGLNKPHYQAPGSDSGRVRRYAIRLIDEGNQVSTDDWAQDLSKEVETPEMVVNQMPPPTELIEGDNYFECPVPDCGHRVSFKPDSRRSYNMAKTNMGKHMLSKDVMEKEIHRTSRSLIFG